MRVYRETSNSGPIFGPVPLMLPDLWKARVAQRARPEMLELKLFRAKSDLM